MFSRLSEIVFLLDKIRLSLYDSEKEMSYRRSHSEKLEFNNDIVLKKITKFKKYYGGESTNQVDTISYKWNGEKFIMSK